MRSPLTTCAITVLGGLVGSPLAKSHSVAPDYSFVVIGCNRLNDVDTAGSPSTANLPALNRLFTEVAALSPKPDYIFFAGDLVLGYTKDTLELERQLTEWVKVYKASPLFGTSTNLVTIPGNHETQDKKAGKKSFAAAERTWLRVMKDYIVGSNGPGIDSTHGDSLSTDQSQLTYSIDHNGDHFVLMDTDPVGRDWRVPTNWLDTNISGARNRGARHIFAIGHKPAYPGPATPTDGLAQYPANRDTFWNILERNHVEAMLASHVHSWQKIQPNPGKTWQIIAGNGGSQWDSIWVVYQLPASTYQGYTLVKVASSGTVKVESWGHDVENPTYYAAHPERPTVLKDSADITWGSIAPTGLLGARHSAAGFALAQNGVLLAVLWNGARSSQPVAQILSVDGRMLSSARLASGPTGWFGKVDLSTLTPGSYVLRLNAGDAQESHAILVR